MSRENSKKKSEPIASSQTAESDAPQLSISLKDKRAIAQSSRREHQANQRRGETVVDEIYELSPEEILPPKKNLLSSLLPSDKPPVKQKPKYKSKPKNKPSPPSSNSSYSKDEKPQVSVKIQDTKTAQKYLFYDASDVPTMILPADDSSDPADTAIDARLDPELLHSLREHQMSGGARSYFDAAPQDTDPQQQVAISEKTNETMALKPGVTSKKRSHTEPTQPPPLLAPLPPTHTSEEAPKKRSISLRPSNLKSPQHESVGETMDFKPPRHQAVDPQVFERVFPVEKSKELVRKVNHNNTILVQFQSQVRHAYLHFHEDGHMTFPKPNQSDQDAEKVQFVFPKFEFGRMTSMSVPIGLTQDDRGQLCESHLVLAKSRKSEPIWSLGIAELKPGSNMTIQFKKWLKAYPKDLTQLTDEQKDQLYLLLDTQYFGQLSRREILPPSIIKKMKIINSDEELEELEDIEALSLTDDDIIKTNPKQKIKTNPKQKIKTNPKQKKRDTLSLGSAVPNIPDLQPIQILPKKEENKWVPRSQRSEVRLPSKIIHPPSATPVPVSLIPSDNEVTRNSEAAEKFLELFEGFTDLPTEPSEMESSTPIFIPEPHTLTAEPKISSESLAPQADDQLISSEAPLPLTNPRQIHRESTGMRRIHMDTTPLDPNELRLHIKIPRRFLGKWFQGTEEELSIYGHNRELKMSSLGLTIKFAFSQTPQGKVFPQVIARRSTNIREIAYAHHAIEICANRNPEAESGWDHTQTLLRGHVAQMDLSATDQVRGIMLIHIHHPKTNDLIDSIRLSWSIKE